MKAKAGVTYGNSRLYDILILLLRVVNIRVFYWFMYIFVIPVMMVVSPGERVAHRYYRRKRSYGALKALWATYRNHCVFGQTVIDKFAVYAGHHFQIHYQGLDLYQEAQELPAPFIQLQAHIGCSEILGYSLPVKKTCNVLAYGGEKKELMNLRAQSFGEMNVHMIPVGTDSSHSVEMVEALDRGEIIITFADRLMGSGKAIVSKLHGHQIRLARSSFQLATNAGINMMMVNTMKESDGSYTAYFSPLTCDRTLPKKEQRQQLADAYTAEMERLLDRYPYQWFNYVDVWED